MATEAGVIQGVSITEKMHQPDLVRSGGSIQSLALDEHPMLPLPAKNRQSGIAAEPINPILIGLNTFLLAGGSDYGALSQNAVNPN